ncbi:ABC transporter ATP-binding protein [Hazenella sp. IB182357]|uniref:ABC transporter ATP-binding protein n=1 Tax=Polycladospora coralii TaxID=2771432 RepID=A0A926RT32_9BACL|nr:ABC transporter ATP-binding protein [Polycladospora coralii]MBD1370802.1 ABC transporter ATP-binding protein [Polycladospora coralii]
MLVAKDLQKSYDHSPVIKNVNLSIDVGKSIAIIGPNGSGKSTLLKLLIGEERLDRGMISFLGEPLTRFSHKERAKYIGVLPQTGLPEILFTVSEIVEMGRYPLQGNKLWLSADDKNRVADMMDELELTAFTHRFLTEMSGGERQRVALAKTMVQEPKLIVLDEPTTYLDLQYQLSILDKLHQWKNQRNTTLLMVLHDINLAALYCDEIIMLKKGEIYQQGSPNDVIQTDHIKAVYGIEPLIIAHPTKGVPQIFLNGYAGG